MPTFCRRRHQMIKVWSSTMPMTIMTGAGDRPRMSNGAPGTRHAEPPAVQVVEAEADEDDGGRREHHPHQVDLDLRPALSRFQLEAQEEHDRREADQYPENRTPADEGAEHPADDEGRHPGAGARRTQGSHGRRLLLTMVVVGDQRHQRGHDHCRGEAGKELGGEHDHGDRAEGHEHLGHAEQPDHRAEDDHRPEALTELGAEHNETGHRKRVEDDSGPTVVGGTLKLWTMPPIETGSAATLNDMITWPSAIAIIGIHDSRSSAPAAAVAVLIDCLPFVNSRCRSDLGPEGEQVQAKTLGEKLRDPLALDTVAGDRPAGATAPSPPLAGRDGDDAAADPALAGRADLLKPAAGALIEPDRRQHGQHALVELLADDALPGDRVDIAIGAADGDGRNRLHLPESLATICSQYFARSPFVQPDAVMSKPLGTLRAGGRQCCRPTVCPSRMQRLACFRRCRAAAVRQAPARRAPAPRRDRPS